MVPMRVLGWVALAVAVAGCAESPRWPTDRALPGVSSSVAADDDAGGTPSTVQDPAATTLPRSGDRVDAPSIELVTVADLDQVVSVVDPPGAGPVLVASLDGAVRSLDLGTGAHRVVWDLGDRVTTGGERGLLGMAADPTANRLYVQFTDRDGDSVVASVPLVDGAPDASARLVEHLRIGQPYRNHNGGHLAFGPDGRLWIGTGDGGDAGDPEDRAQDRDSPLGKLLVLAPGPEGNETPEVWGLGLRNPWRYSFDRATGSLWIADVGQAEVEEVSVVSLDAPAPRNFGWDLVEGDRPFEGEATDDLIAPSLVYEHGEDACSIAGGYVYRGEAVPALRGWYLFGDYCGGWVRAVPADDPGRDPVELAGDLGPVLAFGELEDGELLVFVHDTVLRVVGSAK